MVSAGGKIKNSENSLTETLEKYLLAIHKIVSETKACRVKDVANYLNIGGPTTSGAIKTLAAKGFINYAPYGVITLTEKGEKKAREKILRHLTISNFLEKVLLVEPNKVEEGAKSIEYSMPKDILDKFVSFLFFMDNCSCKSPKWAKSYRQFAKNGDKLPQKCTTCASNNHSKEKTLYCSGCQWIDENGNP